MSWNNQGGGPWRSQGRGPWGQGPRGSQPPGDLEDIIRRIQETLGKLIPGGSGPSGKALGGGGALFLLLAALLLWFAWGTFYTVQPSEVGVNLVFGRYTGKTAAGLNTNWPWPIGSVIKVPVWDQQITEVGYRSLGGSSDIPEESQMLTGDKNIVDVHFRVNWQIDPAKPEDYVFNVLNPRETVKAVAESIMREVVGLKTIDGILTTDRASVEADVQKRMQDLLNAYRAGVLVKQVQLQSVDAPSEVLSAYRDVTAAQQDQQRAVNEAETYANKVVPEAEGGAARIVAEAQAYREQTILEAKGQTARYNQIYQQYKKAPAVTRERMYLETMERVLGPMDKTIVDFELVKRRLCPISRSIRCSPRRERAPNEVPQRRCPRRDRSRRHHSCLDGDVYRQSDRTSADLAVRPARARPHRRAGPLFQVAVCRYGCLYRQAHSRARQRAPGSAGVRQSAPGGRRLRALPYRRSAALLSIRRRHAWRRRATRRHAELGSCAAVYRGRRSPISCATSATL